MLTVARAELLHVAIPFRFAFRHALAERSVGDSVLLVLYDAEDHAGHGECAPRAYVTGETAESVFAALERRLPELLGRRFSTFDELCAHLASQVSSLPREEHGAFCALELAALDLAGKVFGRSAGEVLGPVCNSSIAYSGVVSAAGDEEARKTCTVMKELGVTRAKIKVGGTLEEDMRVLSIVRETLGEEAELRADANCAWEPRTALARIQAFESFRLQALEQPCAADDVEGLAWLTARSPLPVIADESLVSLADAERLARARACHVFNVRISKCGGLVSAGRIRDLGRDSGIGTMLGAHVGETAILAAAGRHFAARTPDLRFAEGSYGKMLLERDLSDAMDLGPGAIARPPTGDGLGFDVDLGRIAPYVTQRASLEARRGARGRSL